MATQARAQTRSGERIDTLIKARWVIPVEPDNTVLEDHALAIDDGRIIEVLPSADAVQHYRAGETIELDEHVLLPGLVNAHGHAAMALFRGLADDYPLDTWLNEYIWPAEGEVVSPAFVRDGSDLAIAEMLRRGTTCFADMYFFPDMTARAAREAGIRAAIMFPVFDMASAWGRDAEEYIHKGLQLHDDCKHSDTLHIGFGPHAPYTNSDGPLGRIATLAEELDAPVHIHLHETAAEVAEAERANGMRPLQRLDRLGLVSPRLQCVHMTDANDEDLALLAERGAHVVHCPKSNLKLASGFAPVHRLQQTGINVALGTDSAASNNDLDMFSEMRIAALLAKAVAGEPTAVPAHTALRMATLNGAQALGLESLTGSLVAGKQADMVAVAMDDLEAYPLYDLISQLVYTQRSHQVTDVWVNGRRLVADKEMTTLNAAELRQRAYHWQKELTPIHQHQQRNGTRQQ